MYQTISVSKLAIILSLCLYCIESKNVPRDNLGAKAWCAPKVWFTKCHSSRDHPIERHNTWYHSIEIRIKKGCGSSQIYNYWSLIERDSGVVVHKYPNRRNKHTILIDRYQLLPGNYVVIANVRETPILSADVWLELKCYIKIVSKCPVPAISGGAHKTVPKGMEVPIRATATITCNLDVVYTWSCSTNRSSSSCNALNGRKGSITSLLVDGQVGDIYTITLSAVAPTVLVQTFQQLIKVTAANTPVLAISCKKNCLPTGSIYSNPYMAIFLKGICSYGCQLIEQYQWVLRALTPTKHTVEEITQNGTYTGANKVNYIIKPNWMYFDEIFELWLYAYGKGRRQLAVNMVHINMTADIGGRAKCRVKNNGQTGMRRLYTINCTVPPRPRPARYRLSQIIYEPSAGEALTQTLASSDIPIFQLRLGSSGNSTLQTLFFVAIDDTMIMTNSTFKVEVPRPFESVSTDELIVKLAHSYQGYQGTRPVNELLVLGRISEASQIMNVILCESAKLDLADPTLQIKAHTRFFTHVAETKILFTNLEFISALIPQLVTSTSKNLHHSKLRSRLCFRLASGFSKMFNFAQYPLTYQEYLEVLIIPLQKCANYYLDDDYETPYIFNISKPPPIPEHVTIVEDYPNYGEFLDEFSNEDLAEIVENSIATIGKVSELYGKTFIHGEPRVHLNFTANTSIDIAHAVLKRRPPYEVGDVSVVLPDSLGFSPNDTVHIVYTSLPAKAFFWDTSTNMSNHIVMLDMYGPDGKVVKKLPSKMDVFFKMYHKPTLVYNLGGIEIPLADVEWTEEFVGKYMKLYRVDVRANNTLMSTIDQIGSVKGLMVAITKLRKPSKADFVGKLKESGRTSYVYNRSDVDTWYYVGFLPQEEEIKKMIVQKRSMSGSDYGIQFKDDYTFSLNRYDQDMLNISFRFGFTSLSCKEWTGDVWMVQHCDVGTGGDEQTMHCSCSDISTLVADVSTVDIKEEKPLYLNYQITTIVNPIIPIVTIVFIAMYCIAICFVYFRKKPLPLYFLSDNVEEDRYAYFLMVYTGAYEDCSTTSNVVIKLFGDKNESSAHVLNYPDPNLSILQDGREDLFILTTRSHLGAITHIQIWYDALGTKYTWFCEYVKVYDLQTNENWFFQLGKRFTVTKKDMHNYTVYPSNGVNWVPKRKFYTYLRFYMTAEHTWNLFKRRNDRTFTFAERISIVFGQIVFTLAIALAIIGRPTLRARDGFGVNQFDDFLFIISNVTVISLVVFVVFCPLILICRYSPQMLVYNSIFLAEDAKIFTNGMLLLCLATLTLIICSSITYLMWFGFWINHTSAMMILTVTGISIFTNITLLENMRLILVRKIRGTYIERFRRKYHLNYQAIIAEAERQRRYLYEQLGHYALRPYLEHLYKPLTESKFVNIQAQKIIEYSIGRSTSDMLFFYLYTSMLFFLLLFNLNGMTYVSSKHITAMALNGSHHNRPAAQEVKCIEDLYSYLNNTLAATIHPMSWYGNWNVSAPGLLDDYSTKVLGVVRIRQKRVRDHYCMVPSFADVLNVTVCQPVYRWHYADKTDLGVSESMWSYQKFEHENHYLGQIYTYDESGFVVNLGRNLNNTYYMIKLMKDSEWLNKRTRVVFIEFWTYNVNQNLFSAVTVAFERSASKYIIVTHSIITLQLMQTSASMEMLSTSIFIVFCMFIFRLILKYIRRIIKYRHRVLFNISHIWEMIIIVTNVTIVAFHLKQYREHTQVFRKFCDSKHNEFIHYFRVMNNYQELQTLTGMVFALAITRGLTFMKFIKAFRLFEKTLVYSFKSFLSVILLAIIVVMMFSGAGLIMFGAYSVPFRSLDRAIFSLLKKGVDLPSDFSGRTEQDYNKRIAVAFYFCFSFCMLVTKNIFIATTILFHRKSRVYLSRTEYPYGLKNYLADKWRYYSELWLRNAFLIRLKGGADIPKFRQPVRPKDDKFRYSNCVIMPDDKLKFMKLLTKAIVRRLRIRQNKPATEVDFELMRNIIASAYRERGQVTSKSLYFVSKSKDGKVSVVNNTTLLEIEYLLNHVLSKDDKDGDSKLTDKVSLARMEDIESILGTVNTIVGNISVKSVKKRKAH